MPDTGAPWNIPYADPSDLVSDWPALSEDIAEAVADGLDGAFSIKQALQAVKVDTFSTTSTSFTTVTGLSQAITPSSTSSRILVVADVALGMSSGNYGHVRLMRGSTVIYAGTAEGSRIPGFASTYADGSAGIPSATAPMVRTAFFVDSPATTSSTTYSVEVRVASGTIYVNRTGTDTNSANFGRYASSITVFEVGA